MILLDTNVVSGLMRPEPDAALARWMSTIDRESFAVSTVTVAEIAFGLGRLPDGKRKSMLTTSADRLFHGMDIVDFDTAMATRSGAFRAKRERAGRPLGFADSMIAGTASQLEVALASRNINDFAGLDLSVVDPWRA
jgi:predicted nucleic acid-binding protein